MLRHISFSVTVVKLCGNQRTKMAEVIVTDVNGIQWKKIESGDADAPYYYCESWVVACTCSV